MTTTHRRWCELAAFLAGTAVPLAACSGSSAPSATGSPIASLATTTTTASGITTGTGAGGLTTAATTSGGASTTTAPGADDPTKLADEWASCMRSHGDPNQADPIIDAYGVINITIPAGVAQALSSQVSGGTGSQSGPYSEYLAAAQSALRAANPAAPPPDNSEYLKYVECMRANGAPNFPYPTGDKTDFRGTGVDPNSPIVEKVNEVCGEKIGAPAWWTAGTGPPGDVSVCNVGPNGVPPGVPPPCFYTKEGCPRTQLEATNG